MSSAVVFGATGATGKYILSTVLGMKEYTKVGEFGRRVTPLESLTGDKSKLVQKTVDFDKIAEDAELKQHHWDVVYIALGTTRAAAGSAEVFERIDREYVLAAAKAAKSSGPQRIVYVSAGSANKNSSIFLYSRSKGLTEEGLTSLGYSDTIIFRPGFLAGANRDRTMIAERIAGKITAIVKYVTDSVEIHVSDLGRAVALAGYLGSEKLPKVANASTVTFDGGKFTLINNAGSLRLAKEPIT